MPTETAGSIQAGEGSVLRKTADIKPHVLVMGLGNILLSDEGAGIQAIERLQARYDIPESVEVIDGGTMGMELISYFDAKRHIIVIDAVDSGHPPGTVTRVDNLPAFFQNKISPHQIGFVDILALAKLGEGVPADMVLFGIQPEKMDVGLNMTPAVSNKIDYLVSKVEEELRVMGIELKLKSDMPA